MEVTVTSPVLFHVKTIFARNRMDVVLTVNQDGRDHFVTQPAEKDGMV